MIAKPHSDFRETVGRIRVAVARDRTLKPRDKLVAFVMLERVNREMWRGMSALLTWASVETVAEDCALSTRDVERARSALLAVGVIERDRPGGRGQAARMRFRLDWLEDEPDDGPDGAFADTGVGDRGVGESVVSATEHSAFGDTTRDFSPTRESPKPCDRIREPTCERTRGAPPPPPLVGDEQQLHRLIARRIGAEQHAHWFRECGIRVTGNRVMVVSAPARFIADQIRTRFADDLVRFFQIRDVEVLVASENPLPANGDRRAAAEGRV